MKKVLLLAAIVGFVFTSCTVAYPGIATGNKNVKEGSIEKKVFMGIALKPIDLSIESACEKSNITKVATVDYSVKRGLFITTYKVMVTGN